MDYKWNESYMYSGLDSVTASILAIYLIALTVMFIFYVIGYVLNGVGLYTIAKRKGMDSPWLAYVPFARVYLQGEIGGELQLKRKSIRNPGIPLLAMPFISGAINFIFYMIFWGVMLVSMMSNARYGIGPEMSTGMVSGMIIVGFLWFATVVVYMAVYKGLTIVVNHQILEHFTSKNMSILHAVFGTFLPLYAPICFFVMRNKEFVPGKEPHEVAPATPEEVTPSPEVIELPETPVVAPVAAPEVPVEAAPEVPVETTSEETQKDVTE